MSEQIPMNIEPTQEHFLQVMRDLGFSQADIDENRQLNGGLYLTPAVVNGAENGFEPGARIDTQTGDIIAAAT